MRLRVAWALFLGLPPNPWVSCIFYDEEESVPSGPLAERISRGDTPRDWRNDSNECMEFSESNSPEYWLFSDVRFLSRYI